ncbi:hypothetical protein MLD38_015641 [Melastoma candidum]|uniref:Uncharacterized protein n=1 Tax=Melastoma candidum TaxID=119954 RepID=A0ACB9RHY6_9MYRT|nr:hypothetical protein MLD38_015641 [Melastoma candidum]
MTFIVRTTYAYKIKRCPRKHGHDWTECPYAHHGEKAQRCDPRRYRTRACNGGRFCQKKLCFFAHSVEELRAETTYKSNREYRARTPRANAPASLFRRASLSTMTPRRKESMDGVSEYMSMLSVSGEEEEGGNGSGGGLEWDLPHLGWITDLVD